MEFRKFRGTDKYLTSSALESAVNCALALERPLLVRGEPGTGETQLAEASAAALGLRLIHWPVKSTTRAQDGLYVYDTVQRLYDSRFGDGDVKDIRRYIKHGPLGQAFASRDRVVLLIDEIDKADPEFANDPLHELDRMRLGMPETGDEVVARARPASEGLRMFVPFLYELRDRGVRVGAQEALSLAQALALELHRGTLDGFYEVARALCVHREQDLDGFDRAFAHHFHGVPDEALALTDELLQWLEQPMAKRQLTELEKELLERIDLAEARDRLRMRLVVQRGRL